MQVPLSLFAVDPGEGGLSKTRDERRPVLGVVGGIAKEARAARGEGDEMRRLEADLFDRLAKLHRRQPLAQKLAEALGRARGRSKSDFDRLGIAVRVNQGEGESADAGVPRGE